MTAPHSLPSAFFQLILSAFILSSCQWDPLGGKLPVIPIPGPTTAVPSPTPESSPPPPLPPPPSRTTCTKKDADYQCLALKIVSYETPDSSTVLARIKAETLVAELNRVWDPCKIQFQLEHYESVNPILLGLEFNPNWRSQASQIRSTFSDNQSLLIVATGKLTSSTIAVTQMPGYAPFGTLVEDSFAENPLTVGHELGHYMGLYHFRNTSNLMNPYIGTHTEKLTQSQCEIARSTNTRNWIQMMR